MNSTEAMALLSAFERISAWDVNDREWARILAGFPVFADVRRRRLRKLVRNATFTEFARGEIVLAPDDVDGSLHVILEGSAKATGGPVPRSMSVGDYFGELSLLGKASPYRVVATQPLYVMRLPGRLVGRLVRQHPALAVTLLRDLAGRLTPAASTRVIAVREGAGTGT
ncbi:MAG TPA: cyclic nucleotide-binding domain-containing protein [Gaiellaceae bacterium]|jgi:signal-transduction protein with cAMP-binding, CBS, and nucleotidyltransferase domain|nr:cyclic nucleotide-binding domain-containing protein [Gaiellaceae bacterium]